MSKIIHAQVKQIPAALWWGLVLLLLVIFIASLFLGRYPSLGWLTPTQLRSDALAQRLLLNIRLPRLITALILGMTLTAAGSVFQMLFANPLVEPGFLGVSQGAAFGASLAIVSLGAGSMTVQGSAVIFAMAGLGLSYLLARRIRYGGWVLRLVLSGIAVSALFTAGVGILKYLADPFSQLPEITFWMLGSLASITWAKLFSVLPVSILGLVVMFLLRWRLNLLALNDETAFSLGAAPRRERILLLTAAVLPTAVVISVAGMVGWVGLIIPHIARRVAGTDTRTSLPVAMFFGAAFTILCDDLGRLLIAGEIPLGILTSLIGAAVFIILMASKGFKVKP